MSGQGYVTNNENALEELFSDDENHQRADACLNVVAKRIATVLASLKVRGTNFKACLLIWHSYDSSFILMIYRNIPLFATVQPKLLMPQQ